MFWKKTEPDSSVLTEIEESIKQAEKDRKKLLTKYRTSKDRLDALILELMEGSGKDVKR